MDAKKFDKDTSYTQNRELSWLKFNRRVLEEANDENVPLYERFKFLAIFSSNLDEFYMIRVGSLFDLSLMKDSAYDNKTGETPEQQLKEIYKVTAHLYKLKDKSFEQLEQQFRHYDMNRLGMEELQNSEKKIVSQYFKGQILPILSPQIIDTRHPFPHLENKSLHIAVMIKEKDTLLFGLIPIPKNLPRLIFFPGSGIRYLLLEDIVLHYAQTIFDMYQISEKTVICVTRNADINPDDEAFDVEDDYRHHMIKILKKRAKLSPVRLEIQSDISTAFASFLLSKLNIKKDQLFKSSTPLNLSYISLLEDKLTANLKKIFTYPPFLPQHSAFVSSNEPMLKQVFKRDILLSYPYESMQPFLSLMKEASDDPAVISIKITLYRIDKKSKLAEHLIAAAENKKDVTVLMELRARFDEQNNIDWAERLEDAGCKVIYGFEHFKVHSKICLITRKEKGKIQYITQIGTGNYNEKTAKLYTDLSMITANQEIGNDANLFFKNMSVSNLQGHYSSLLVAPSELKKFLIALIDREIQKVKKGGSGHIILKMNSLTDREMIDKLSEASCAGVIIHLIVRGICCIVPKVPGKTDNITVISIVGRFLEHSRIFCFGEGEDLKIYLSSADMMTRNTERRVEIACPVTDRATKSRIHHMITTLLSDNIKARELQVNKDYARIRQQDQQLVDAQEYFMQYAMDHAAKTEVGPKNIFERILKGIRSKLTPPVKEDQQNISF